jgi:hypothetical protein
LTQEENNFLPYDFAEKVVYEAIMEMEKNKASGPYGFPTEFYQKIRQILNMT